MNSFKSSHWIIYLDNNNLILIWYYFQAWWTVLEPLEKVNVCDSLRRNWCCLHCRDAGTEHLWFCGLLYRKLFLKPTLSWVVWKMKAQKALQVSAKHINMLIWSFTETLKNSPSHHVSTITLNLYHESITYVSTIIVVVSAVCVCWCAFTIEYH